MIVAQRRLFFRLNTSVLLYDIPGYFFFQGRNIVNMLNGQFVSSYVQVYLTLHDYLVPEAMT